MAFPAVSVIIPAYNAEKTIQRTLESLSHQSFKGIIEIIVVDDGSQDQTARIVSKFPQVKYILQDNAGPATARNRGAQIAEQDILFFTDSDCIPEIRWIEKMVVPLQDPSVSVVAGGYGIANPECWLARCIHREILYRHHHLMPVYPKSFGSYNFCIRRQVFHSVEGFDPEYRFASGEDNALSYKVLANGHKIYFEKGAIVLHIFPTGLKKYLSEQYRHGFWRVKMYRDHPQMSFGDDYTFFKDIAEVPISLGIMAFGILSFVKPLIFIPLIVFFSLIICLLQFYYSYVMTKNFRLFLGYAIVMLLRSFARTIGFSSGLVNLMFLGKVKKN